MRLGFSGYRLQTAVIGIISAALWLPLLFARAFGKDAGATVRERRSAPQTRGRPWRPNYIDVALKAGLTGRNVFGGTTSKRYLLETTGTGVGVIDYNRDGLPDLFFANGTTVEGFPGNQQPTNHLYRNNGDGTFTDVTAQAGLVHSGWAQGVCIGDYDNDGWDDIFVTYYGKNLLYHNNGNGTFTEVAEKAGVAGDAHRWNTGCAFVDYDRDGKLDLFVAGYVDQGSDFRLLPKPGSGQFCSYKGISIACGPRGLKPARNYLFHNNGDGTFTDVSERAGILLPTPHYALGVLTLDYENDGWPDIYVACDSTASILYHNNHNGTFTDRAFMTGAAYSGNGEPQAGMGVSAGDYNGDGWLDIVKTNFSDDTPDLYRNNGDGTFVDDTFATGLGLHTNYLGWGVGFFDYDNDGWPDLFMANGHIAPEVDQRPIDTTFKQPRLLYHNEAQRGERRFIDVSGESGAAVRVRASSRGAAFADFRNNGQIGIAISNMNEMPSLLVNTNPAPGHWIDIRTIGTRSNRDGIGTRVEVFAGEHRQIDEVRSGGSYISQNDLRLHFGLGAASVVDRIVLRWPSGAVQRLSHVTADRVVTVEEGRGIVNGAGANSLH